MENLSLIAGLGNPGREYARTRHNAGFMVVDALAQRWRLELVTENRFQARIGRSDFGGGRVWLCQPHTYMNASGEAVAGLANFYRIAPAEILAVVDDADLPLGTLRLRPDGSSGGHHGLESIEQHLGTRLFPRQRVGIGRMESAGRDITGHVLSSFSTAERAVFDQVLVRACDQIECWLAHGLSRAMNQFNGAVHIESEER